MVQEKAKNIIKTHIANHGHQPITVSKQMVRYWWNVFNYAVFDGAVLPACKIELLVAPTVFAWAIPCTQTNIRLQIQHEFFEKTTFLTVLVHEMVHAWEYQMFGKMGHGRQFKTWETPIYEHTQLVLSKRISEYEHTKRFKPNTVGSLADNGYPPVE